MYQKRIAFGIVAAWLMVTVSAAQEATGGISATEGVAMQDTLTVVDIRATSRVQRLERQALPVTALDVRRLYNAAGDLSQHLNRTTGLRIREAGGVGSDYNLSLNGFSGRQIKVFLDGIPLSLSGSAWNLSTIPTAAVEHVEIYKGVLPVHLGADALGGALNIVSRIEANYLDVSYAVGSFNTHRASVNGAYRHVATGLTVRLNAYFNSSDNDYPVYVPILDLQTNRREGYRTVRRFHDGYRAAGVKLEAGITGRPYADYLLASLVVAADDKDIQTGVTMESVFGAKTSAGRSLIPALRYKKTNLFVSGLDFSLYATLNDIRYRHVDTTARRYNWLAEWVPSSTNAETTRSRLSLHNNLYQTNANLNYRLSEGHTFSFNYLLSSFDRKLSDPEDPDNLTYKLPQRLDKHVAGLGYTFTRTRWNATILTKLYRMNARSYHYVNMFKDDERLEPISADYFLPGYGAAIACTPFTGWQAKLSYERTCRLPEGEEIFGDGLFSSHNPDLKPESSHNANLSLSHQATLYPAHTLVSALTLLYRDTRDYIQKELRDPATQYINLGAVITRSVEAELRYAWQNRLNASAGITFQDITDNMRSVSMDSYTGSGNYPNLTYKDRLPNIPYFFGNFDLGLSLPTPKSSGMSLSLDYSLLYIHQYYLSWPSLGMKSTKNVIPQQNIHNASINCSLAEGRYNICFECTNFTDQRAYDNYLLQKPGRAFHLKLRYALHA
ncbi:MAG: TonB-dependent receptor plug domain-containing protein [Tannerellaceae bacterium]|jgi:outer membrane receptor protein involved in Fe transport|nr:TonB-dependent receptor plug domain-containing protein [Tannerellaceae bacterium]